MARVDIPDGDAISKVTIIDNGARIKGPMGFFMEPSLLDHLQEEEDFGAPALCLPSRARTQRKTDPVRSRHPQALGRVFSRSQSLPHVVSDRRGRGDLRLSAGPRD